MLSPAHEIAVARLARDPMLLPALAEKLLGRPVHARPPPADSTVRIADPAEVRPDLVLADGERGPWDAIEVQLRIDDDKGRRWLLLAAALHDQRECMGDLWILTPSPRTARWARAVCRAAGPAGTRMGMKPIVLLVGRSQVERLLDEGRPSLAFFAAWAMQRRHGEDAVEVVGRAVEITSGMEDEGLRRRQQDDIMGVLNGRIRQKLREMAMEEQRSTTPKWVRELQHDLFGKYEAEWAAQGDAKEAKGKAEGEAKGKAEGKRDALLLVLKGRGLAVTRAQRAAILGCEDLARLDRWIAASGTATSVRELLAETPKKKNGARNSAAKHRAARSS